MVIWPKSISAQDEGWRQACALMQVLALDPRKPSPQGHRPRGYYETADDYLVRPMIMEERKRVPAPYFQYALRFNVSASVHGAIPIDATNELEEFKLRVNTALQCPLTVAERNLWDATSRRLICERAGDFGESESVKGVARKESVNSAKYYDEVRESIAAKRRYTNFVAASLCTHEEVLSALIQKGTDMLQAGQAVLPAYRWNGPLQVQPFALQGPGSLP